MLEAQEIARNDCFLCRPSARLLVDVGENGYALAGLGPIVDAYAIVATVQHAEGPAASTELMTKGFLDYAQAIQSLLAQEFGRCVLTEHGKAPVCVSDQQESEHCFHPHFLLFPSAPDPTDRFTEYFQSRGERFAALSDAISCAVKLDNYLLVSADLGEYTVFDAGAGMPRQFARAVIAEGLGIPDLASWRSYPDAAWSLKNASVLRKILNGRATRFGGR